MLVTVHSFIHLFSVDLLQDTEIVIFIKIQEKTKQQHTVPYFLAYKMHRPIRRTMIFSLEILE
jgi:hypothetical protein